MDGQYVVITGCHRLSIQNSDGRSVRRQPTCTCVFEREKRQAEWESRWESSFTDMHQHASWLIPSQVQVSTPPGHTEDSFEIQSVRQHSEVDICVMCHWLHWRTTYSTDVLRKQHEEAKNNNHIGWNAVWLPCGSLWCKSSVWALLTVAATYQT